MITEAQVDHRDSLGEILGRAFDSVSDMPAAMAEMILKADFPKSDKDQVDALLAKKAESSLSKNEEFLLDAYLNADLLLIILKSKARQALRHPIAA